ncbi:MAG: DUF6440 family protein [Ruminococcus flavefaciens]|nr:DUF6440 family protein [Ruminococcus flavefaciens]MCM1361910.1 DUF6440 family protein [Clostridiales bacterium]MCM1434478.1 DUF6440 family protein [Ruminococcus flavefaciens]
MFEKKEKKKKRFIVKEDQALGFGAVKIIVDTVTGVNYLCTVETAMNGITPLLDKNGNVVIDDINKINED